MGIVDWIDESYESNVAWRILFWWVGILGTLWALDIILRLMKFCCKHNCRRYRKNLYQEYGSKSKDSYAVVTGGSDGIGLAYCKELASQGFNICIIGRNKEKIEGKFVEIKDECSLSDKIKFKCIIADFGKLNSLEDYDPIVKELSEIDIGLLILNAGVTGPFHQDRLPRSAVRDMINCNVSQIAYMVRLILPQLKKRGNKSGILMVSSMASVVYGAFGVNYHASKAYVTSFARSLYKELRFQNIDVLAYCPGVVNTKMMAENNKDNSGIWPDHAAKVSLRDLGVEPYTFGSMGHDFTAWMLTKAINLDYFDKPAYDAGVKVFETDKQFDWIRELEKKEAEAGTAN